MRIHRDIKSLPEFKNAVITIGSFDGVHRGHQKIISRINKLANDIEGESVIITFDPHPRKIIYPRDKSLKLLSTTDEKLLLFEKYGLDHVVIVPFSIEFSQQNPREYLDKFIMSNFNPSYIVIGYDHRFGLNRSGDIHMLKRYSLEHGFKVLEIKKQEIEDITISSTKIRNALLEGDISHANLFLGHHYIIKGIVVHGDKIGKQLGFPTANISISENEKLIPKKGIYAVQVVINEKKYGGMMYIGDRPTINTAQKTSIEVNIFDFNGDLYGETIEVELVAFIRYDEKYDELKLLRNQLVKDKATAQHLLSNQYNQSEEEITLAIAILNYNGVDFLESYLPSVIESCPDYAEVVVIDNNSDDESVNYLEEWHPEVKIVNLHKNYGFAGGYNRGMEEINQEFTFLLNSDVLVENGCIEHLMNVILNSDDTAIVQPTILSLEEKKKYEYAGAAGGLVDKLGYPFCRGRIFEETEEINNIYTDAEIFWASGAAMLVKTKIFKALGGFDRDYFAHQEEIDFCWRAKRAGYKIKFVSDSIVYHLGGGTLSYDNPQKAFLNFRNNLYTIIKNESVLKLMWLLPFRFILDGAAALHFLLQKKPKHILSIIKAHWTVLFTFRKYWMKRAVYNKLIDKHKIAPPNYIGKINKSIVWQYFILGRKRVADILKLESTK
jgi:riboflavin kinase/FMN adenylyltransferase